MTVLYFADTRFPIERANGAQTMATCHALAARGHQVTLVARPDTAPVSRDPFEFYGLPRVAGLTFAPIAATGGRVLRRFRFLAAALVRAAGHRATTVYTRDLGVAASLMRLPASVRPRLVYESHGIAPIVIQQHPGMFGRPDLEPSKTKVGRLDRRERFVWRRASAYVTITHALARELADRYGPRPNVFVAPDGANEIPPADEPGVTPVAAYAGHLYPWKGVDVFIRALALAPRVHGLVIGGPPREDDLGRVERLAQELGVTARLEMTGLVAPAEVARHLRRASILVLPNTATAISERYTSPLKLFEYLWIGRPIVASDLTAVREVLTDGVTALLVPPDDASALAHALERLATDHQLAASLGRAARALAPRFTWAARAVKLEAALDAARS